MKPFDLSCTTCATRGFTWDEVSACFTHAPAAGYRYWGLAGPPLWLVGGYRWFDWKKVKNQAAEAGLRGLTEVYGPPIPTDSVAMAESAARETAHMFELARNLECGLVVFTGGSRKAEDGLQTTIAGLKTLLSGIKQYPVKLALEPHFRSRVSVREDFDVIFGEIDDPQVGITIDCGHLHSAQVDWKALIRDYADKIINVHLKDHSGTQSVPIGEGEIDIRGLIEVLAEIEYQGVLALELEVEDPINLPRYIREARELLLNMVHEVTGTWPD